MSLEPFEGPLLKLRRGRQHVAELERAIAAYTARVPIYRTARFSASMPGYIDGEMIVREVPPHEFAVMLGDAIHNMRVALDFLANDLVKIENGNTKGVYFPFTEDASGLEQRIKDRNFHRAAPEAVDLLRQFEPYRGGNDRLRGLHDLDVQDKNQMVIPAIGHIRYPARGIGIPGLEAKPGVVLRQTMLMSTYDHDTSIAGDQLPVIFDLIFPFNGPFDGLSVIPTLTDLSDYIFSVFQAFASLYGRQLSQ